MRVHPQSTAQTLQCERLLPSPYTLPHLGVSNPPTQSSPSTYPVYLDPARLRGNRSLHSLSRIHPFSFIQWLLCDRIVVKFNGTLQSRERRDRCPKDRYILNVDVRYHRLVHSDKSVIDRRLLRGIYLSDANNIHAPLGLPICLGSFFPDRHRHLSYMHRSPNFVAVVLDESSCSVDDENGICLSTSTERNQASTSLLRTKRTLRNIRTA